MQRVQEIIPVQRPVEDDPFQGETFALDKKGCAGGGGQFKSPW